MREWWLEGADPAKAAERLDVELGTLHRVLDGSSDMSPGLAMQLEAGGGTASSWLRLQATYDCERLPKR